MKFLRTRLGLDRDRDAGLSLIEVVVAMLMFAIVSAGVIYALLSVMRVTKDSRDRQVAANLAAEEIDLTRDAEDLFLLLDNTRTVALNGDTFTVARTTNWVSNSEADLPCGSGGGTLKYKHVKVVVTWSHMRSGVDPVRADTVIDPNNRINDPTLGTILVSVLGASGSGTAGVTVTARPDSSVAGNTARALTTTPAQTDAQGCSYILKVFPGSYIVEVTKANHVSSEQLATGTKKDVVVAAGAAFSASFAYDLGGVLDLRYVSNPAPAGVKIPSNLDTSFTSTYGVYVSTAENNTLSRSIRLHPFTSGYNVFAGYYREGSEASAGCKSVDPGQWLPGVVSGQNVIGLSQPAVPAVGGTTLTTVVPMGVVRITNTNSKYLRVVSSATLGQGDPGCAKPMTYLFTQEAASDSVIALPYGSWEIYQGDTSNNRNSPVPGNRISIVSTGTVAVNVVTLDPRVVAP